MTNDTDPNRARTDEIAQLRRELAELRRDTDRRLHLLEALVDDGRRNVTYLFRDTQRLDRIHRKLRRTVREMSQRVDGTEAYLPHLVDQIDQRLATAYEAITALQTTAEARNHTLLKTAGRVDLAQEAMELIVKDIKHLRSTVDQYVTKLDERATTHGMWIGHLASRTWPSIDAFHDEIERVFPQGFGTIPYYRLMKKKSDC